MPRPEVRWALVALAAGGVAAGCRGVAALVLDLPPPRPATAGTATAAPRSPAVIEAAQDTVRPMVERMHDPDSVLALLPRDSGGNVDWAAAIRTGAVRPRRALPGRPLPPDPSGFAYDFVLEGAFEAVFPHSSHTAWMGCRTCHPALFPYRNQPISMSLIGEGKACGVCHRTVAFSDATCFRCHPSLPPSGTAEPELKPDVVFRRDSSTAGAGTAFPPSIFPHWVHRIRYTCGACHPDVFSMQPGPPTLTMAGLQRGEACGVCHTGQEAFGLAECTRCHVSPDEPGGGVR